MIGDWASWLLLLRAALANAVGVAFLVIAWANGWVQKVVYTPMVPAICAVFVLGLGLCWWRLVLVSRDLNRLRSGLWPTTGHVAEFLAAAKGQSVWVRAEAAALLRLKLESRIAPIRHIANILVLLGLIGTVVGFIVALSGIRPDIAGDIHAVGKMITVLIEGMGIALHTTLVGAILNIWLNVNYRILEGGVVRLYAKAVEAVHDRRRT